MTEQDQQEVGALIQQRKTIEANNADRKVLMHTISTRINELKDVVGRMELMRKDLDGQVQQDTNSLLIAGDRLEALTGQRRKPV